MRKHNLSTSPKYTLSHKIDDRHSCVYCGELSDALDHVPPVSINGIQLNHDFDEEEKEKNKFLLVPCCKECNTSLGNRYLLTIEDRAGYLLSKYKRKYKKFNAHVTWVEEDIDELDHFMKKYISGWMHEQSRIRDRIENLKLRIALKDSDMTSNEQTANQQHI